MITWIIVICSALLILATAEVQIWGFTLNRHAWWMKKHPGLERRCINYKSLFYTSIYTSVLSAITMFAWIFLIVMGCACSISGWLLVFLFFIAIGSKILLISYLHLIAKLCRLNKYYYPPLTVWLCKKFNGWMS